MLFFKKKKSLQRRGVLIGMTDWHSHILPGVDDGIQSMKESLATLDFYGQIGIKEIWLTPHIMEDIPNTPEHLHSVFEELCSLYKGDIKLNLAAENMLDNLFYENLKKGNLMTIGPQRDHLLIETSYFNPPMSMENTLKAIMSEGIYPVLAHPERYFYMTDKDYRKYKDMGVKFQLNLPSLTGSYGSEVRKKAEYLQKNGYYDYSGTDIHSLEYFKKVIEKSF